MTVYLVGAGPGAADLLTLRAARLLGKADVVIHDRLVGEEIFDFIAPWAERIDVGKDPHGRVTSQDEINRLLVRAGKRGGTVVRLKGGDPFIFGRGGEEALALQAAGLDVAVVPGISSSVAAPAMAGVSVTQRGLSSGFTVLTGHQDPKTARPIDWDAAARLGTTLVVLMGARRAAEISLRLQEGGMAPETPVAVITNATTPDQTVAYLPLIALGERPVVNPAVIVIGEVAGSPVLDPQDPTLRQIISEPQRT